MWYDSVYFLNVVLFSFNWIVSFQCNWKSEAPCNYKANNGRSFVSDGKVNGMWELHGAANLTRLQSLYWPSCIQRHSLVSSSEQLTDLILKVYWKGKWPPLELLAIYIIGPNIETLWLSFQFGFRHHYTLQLKKENR